MDRFTAEPQSKTDSYALQRTSSGPRACASQRAAFGSKSILIIGNGPSTRALVEQGLHNIRSDVDTFGMCAAYRYFREVNWWPTYFAIGDSKLVFSHRKELAKVVEDPKVTTERFYLSYPVTSHPRLEQIHHCSTGDFCFRKCLERRYQRIYLIGIEGHYVEELVESRPLSNEEYFELGYNQLNLPDTLRKTLRIISETPEDNPNYFFDGYQQAGDVYSLPQGHIHRDRWGEAATLAEATGSQVLNLSEVSKIAEFPKTSISNIAKTIFSNSGDLNGDDRAGISKNKETYVRNENEAHSGFWFGPFDREHSKRVDEAGIIFELFRSAPPVNPNPVMVDVGACKGGAFHRFLNEDWTIHAFEPNPPLFQNLLANFNSPRVTLNGSAVSDVEGEEIPFYTSEESIGISSLQPFRPTHEITAKVKTIRLDKYLREHDLHRIEFLKIDTEGFDLMVLQGLDLIRFPVDAILCEFEDSKTKPLGYSTHDLAHYLMSFGYTIYLSEWHPVIRYGVAHQWRAIKRYPCELEDANAWGNLLAFRTDPGIWAVSSAVKQSTQRFEAKAAKKTRKNKRKGRLRKISRAFQRPVEHAVKNGFRRILANKPKGETNNDRSRKAG